jgi:16S rRNA (uracil1498-N3)-methyltransferase
VRRFIVRPEAAAAGRVRFDRAESHHLRRVLRLRRGALVEAADGAGRLFTVRLDEVGPGAASGTILGEVPATRESACAVTLGQAVLKGERMTWLVQKATELGVARIVPVLTERVVARAPDAGERRRRWERVAQEAVKQCGRAVVPPIEPPRPLAAMLAEIAEHDVTWLCWEGGGVAPAEAARGLGRPRRVLLLVGPEGGLTVDEVRGAVAAGARVVGLGPRVLRAESAGLVAVTLCQYLFGDLGSPDETRP